MPMSSSREFSLEDARATLATIREHVLALQEAQAQLRRVKAALNALNRRHMNNGVAGERELRERRLEQRRLGEEAEQLVRVITSSGAEIKGVDDGLVDFPTVIDGELAYWCWKAGEADIEWWHLRSTGIAGRRRISAGM
jgi:hypothetical protein